MEKQFDLICKSRDKAVALLFSPRGENFRRHFGVVVSNGQVHARGSLHSGIEDGQSFVLWTLDQFVMELGKRIFRNRFPEKLRGLATRIYYEKGG